LLTGKSYKIMLAIILILSIMTLGCGTIWFLAVRGQALLVKKILLYALTTVAFFAGLGMVGTLTRNADIVLLFCTVEAAMLVAGLVHQKILLKLFARGNEGQFLQDLLFTCMLLALGSLVFSIIFQSKDKGEYIYLFVWTGALFPLPLLLLESFRRWKAIPYPVYKQWFYPTHNEIPLIELGQTIPFFFKTGYLEGSIPLSKIAVKMPPEKRLGELFQYFIYRYNTEKSPSEPIVVSNAGRMFGWLFYTRNWLGVRRYLDPDLTLIENGIYKHAVITALAAKVNEASGELQEKEALFG
jgi:Type VI secretion system, TssN